MNLSLKAEISTLIFVYIINNVLLCIIVIARIDDKMNEKLWGTYSNWSEQLSKCKPTHYESNKCWEQIERQTDWRPAKEQKLLYGQYKV